MSSYWCILNGHDCTRGKDCIFECADLKETNAKIDWHAKYMAEVEKHKETVERFFALEKEHAALKSLYDEAQTGILAIARALI